MVLIFPIDSSKKKTIRPADVKLDIASDQAPFTGKNEKAFSAEYKTKTQQYIERNKKSKNSPGSGIAFNEKELPGSGNNLPGSGIDFNNEASGIDFNNEASGLNYSDSDLEKDFELETKKGGALPVLLGELALNLVAQAPAIISAIKARKEGKGMPKKARESEVATLLTGNGVLPWDQFDREDYENLIDGFKKIRNQGRFLKRNEGGSVIVGSGKVKDFLKKSWNWIKNVYNNNKDIIDPLKNALISTAKSAITNKVNQGVDTVASKIGSKVNSDAVKSIIDQTGKAVKDISERAVEQTASKLSGQGEIKKKLLVQPLGEKKQLVSKTGDQILREPVF